MVNRIAVLAVALALAPAAVAQERPAPAAPAKHENKVTDAAKAAFEKMEKAMYSAVGAGLKDLSGTLELKIEGGEAGPKMDMMGGMNVAFRVGWKAGEELKVESKGEAQGPMRMMGDGMKKMAVQLLRMSLGLMKPMEGEEYDADAVTEGGKTLLTLVHYKNGAESSRTVFTLGENGCIESAKFVSKGGAAAGGPAGGPGAGGRGGRMGPPGGDEGGTMQYSWKKEGDRWLLEKMTTERMGKTVEISPVYTDAEGFKILTSWKMAGGMGGAVNMGFRFTDLVVNGKTVTLASGEAAKPAGDGGMGDMGGGK